jgi:hypothetical protein
MLAVSRKMFMVVVTTNTPTEQTKEKRFFLHHSDAAKFAQSKVFFHVNKQVTTRIYKV